LIEKITKLAENLGMRIFTVPDSYNKLSISLARAKSDNIEANKILLKTRNEILE